MGVQSLDKAVEVQADYAKQAYENFVTELQRIFGLYSQLAGQAFNRGKRQAWKRIGSDVLGAVAAGHFVFGARDHAAASEARKTRPARCRRAAASRP